MKEDEKVPSRKSSRDSDTSKNGRSDKIRISGFKSEKDIDQIKEKLKEYGAENVDMKSVEQDGETTYSYELGVSNAAKVIAAFSDGMFEEKVKIEHLKDHSRERKRKSERTSHDSHSGGEKKVRFFGHFSQKHDSMVNCSSVLNRWNRHQNRTRKRTEKHVENGTVTQGTKRNLSG